jgi:hypothetical protein
MIKIYLILKLILLLLNFKIRGEMTQSEQVEGRYNSIPPDIVLLMGGLFRGNKVRST